MVKNVQKMRNVIFLKSAQILQKHVFCAHFVRKKPEKEKKIHIWKQKRSLKNLYLPKSNIKTCAKLPKEFNARKIKRKK